MKLDYKHLLPGSFAPDARVWVYQSNRMLSFGEALELETMLEDFVAGWKSHGEPVKGYANLFFGRFIVLMADETATMVSGCSTDSSVHLVKQAAEKFGVDFFNRQLLSFVIKDKVEVLPMTQLPYAVENEFVTADTLYFNNTVLTKKELEENWLIPAGQSWLGRRFFSTAAQ